MFRQLAAMPRLSRTLIVALSVFSLIPVAIAALFAITVLDHVVRRQTDTALTVAANLTQATILQLLDYLRGRTADVADDWYIKDTLAAHRVGPELDRYLAVNRSHIPESDELFVVDNGGRVVASSDAASLGRDDSRRQYFVAGRDGMYVGHPARTEDGRVRWIVATPILDRHSGARLGVLANSVDKRVLSDVTTGRKLQSLGIADVSLRRGRTGEVYLVDRDGFMLTESRFIDQAVLATRVDTPPVQLARRQGGHMLGNYTDYRGVPVTGASAVIPGLGWIVVAEVDQVEAVRPIRYLQVGLILLGVALVPAVGALGVVIHRSTVRPVQRILAADERVTADGPASGLLDANGFRYREWRQLVEGRNVMLTQLHEQSDRLRRQLETERLYRQIQEADRRKDMFLATLAHELRTPLTAITSAAHALDVLPAQDTKRPTLRRIISDQAMQIARLVDDLFDVSRIIAGKFALELQPAELMHVLRRVIDAIETTERAAPGQIIVSELAGPLVVLADGPRLERVFRNLLDNALKYSPPGAPIHVSLERQAGDAVVRVCDAGVGISPEDLPYIFEPFRQSKAAAREGGGLGLGLALVRGLVEQHRGRITASSSGLGKGSEFVVRLPLTERVG
jgi:signal transduction histidine kinase